MLVLDKSLALARLGKRAEGTRLLEGLLGETRCTAAVEAMAKMTLPLP